MRKNLKLVNKTKADTQKLVNQTAEFLKSKINILSSQLTIEKEKRLNSIKFEI